MRFLSTFCGLLLLANLLVLLWPSNDSKATHVYSERSEVNPNFIRLNKEIEEKHLQAKPSEEQNDPIALNSDAIGGCYRLGPFMHQENFELAQAVLYNANVEYKKTLRKAKKSRVFRVYLGPYVSQAEAVDVRSELRAKNILDHFIRRQGSEAYIVSLGIYTSKETADAALNMFVDRVTGVKVDPEELILPDSYWLQFAMSSVDGINVQLSQMDWGEQSAKFGKFACATT